MFAVLNDDGDEIVRGTRDECFAFIMARCEIVGNKRIYRTWTEDDIEYFDIGEIYCIVGE